MAVPSDTAVALTRGLWVVSAGTPGRRTGSEKLAEQRTQKLPCVPGQEGPSSGGGSCSRSLHQAPSRALSCQPQGS